MHFHNILLKFFDRMFLARIPMGPWTLSCIFWDSYSDPFLQTCCSLFHCRGLTLRYLPYTPVGKMSSALHFFCGTMSCYLGWFSSCFTHSWVKMWQRNESKYCSSCAKAKHIYWKNRTQNCLYPMIWHYKDPQQPCSKDSWLLGRIICKPLWTESTLHKSVMVVITWLRPICPQVSFVRSCTMEVAIADVAFLTESWE